MSKLHYCRNGKEGCYVTEPHRHEVGGALAPAPEDRIAALERDLAARDRRIAELEKVLRTIADDDPDDGCRQLHAHIAARVLAAPARREEPKP